MSANPGLRQCCPNRSCDFHGAIGNSNIVLHSYLKVKCGRHRRYRCKACGKTFSLNTNTPYHRLHASRSLFDRVAHLSVEGVSISAIARICGRSWSTISRWLKKGAQAARTFNDHRLRHFEVNEVQADEIRTFCGSKRNPRWIFATLEVGPRLWVSTVVGRRSYHNTRVPISDTVKRSYSTEFPLITTDGYKHYRAVV